MKPVNHIMTQIHPKHHVYLLVGVAPLILFSLLSIVSAQPCVSPPAGLVSWWPGEGNANDIRDGNHGTLRNGATFAAGMVGEAFRFDGVDDFVEVPHSANLNLPVGTSHTIEVWAFRTSPSLMHLVGKRVGCGSDFNFYQLAIGVGAIPTEAVPLNVWSHLAVSYDGSTQTLIHYVNGAVVATGTLALDGANTAPLKIGNSGTCSPFAGLIDEVGIYNRALSASQVQTIFNAGSAGKCKPPCVSAHTSGSGATLLQVCFSNHGNLVLFESPAGFGHIQATSGEGYAVCSGSATVHGFDAGVAEAGFGPPTISQPNGPSTFPLTITRTTTDSVFRLQQTFARDTTEKDVLITMTLTNLSAASRTGVMLSRYFNGNMDNDIADDRYARTADAVWGWEDGTGRHGLRLTAQTFGTTHSTAVETFANWNPTGSGARTARTCTPVAQATPTATGDFVGRVTYNFGTVAAGSSRTVQVLYRRF